MKRRSNNLFGIAIISFIIVMFILSFVNFFSRLNSNIENTINNIVLENCTQDADSYFTKINKMSENLKATAEKISAYDSLKDPAITEIIHSALNDERLIKLDLIDINGNVLNNDAANYKIDKSFLSALKGPLHVSNINNDDNYTVLSVPIIRGEKTIGVLSGYYEFKQINSLISAQYNYLSYSTLFLTLKSLLLFILLTFYIMSLLRKKTDILIKQKCQLDALTSNVPGGVQCCENDEFLTIHFVSDGFLSLTGFTRDEIAINFNNQYLKMIYPKDRVSVLHEIRENRKAFFEIQYRLIRKDGTVIWILDKGQLVPTNEKDCALYSVLVDISALKRTENELIESQQQLQVSNEKYEIVIDHAGIVTFDFDIPLNTISFSKIYRKKFGYSPPTEDFPNCFIAENIIHPDDIEDFNNYWESMLSGTKNSKSDRRILNAKGEYILCRVHTTTIYDENDIPRRVVGMITDIE